MNEKIKKDLLFNLQEKIYTPFVEDKFGDWSYSTSGNSPGYFTHSLGWYNCHCSYNGSGTFYDARPTIKRTLPRISKASQIEFNYACGITGGDYWGTRNRSILLYIGDFKINNGSVSIGSNTIASIGETSITTDSSGEYVPAKYTNIVIKQTCVKIDGVVYEYPQGVTFKDNDNDEFYSYLWFESWKGGWSCWSDYRLFCTPLIVKG